MNPWKSLPERAPYVLDMDRELVRSFNVDAKQEHRIETALLPEPFLGRPDAPVVLLNLNPGVSLEDRRVHEDVRFRAAAVANLKHGHSSCPLFLLDPSLPNSPGRVWWQTKLRPLINEFGVSVVASKVFVIEIHGYHSLRYSQRLAVPSQAYARYLVIEAITRGAQIIIMRGRRPWERLVPELSLASKIGYVRNAQNPVISPANLPGWFDRLLSACRAA